MDSSCRERPSTSDEQVTTAQNGATYPRSPPRETVHNAVHLDSSCRERLITGVEQIATAQNDSAYPRSPRQKIVNNEVYLNSSSTFNQPSNHFHNQEVNTTEQHSTHQLENSMSHIKEDVHEEARSSDVTLQGTSSEVRNLDSEEFADRTASFKFWAENEIAEEVEVIDHDMQKPVTTGLMTLLAHGVIGNIADKNGMRRCLITQTMGRYVNSLKGI